MGNRAKVTDRRFSGQLASIPQGAGAFSFLSAQREFYEAREARRAAIELARSHSSERERKGWFRLARAEQRALLAAIRSMRLSQQQLPLVVTRQAS